MKQGSGWYNESQRHRLARMGYKTSGSIQSGGELRDGQITTMRIEDINTRFQELPENSFGQVLEIMGAINDGREMPPILVSKNGFLQDGRHRLDAFRRLGYKEVNVIIGQHPNTKAIPIDVALREYLEDKYGDRFAVERKDGKFHIFDNKVGKMVEGDFERIFLTEKAIDGYVEQGGII